MQAPVAVGVEAVGNGASSAPYQWSDARNNLAMMVQGNVYAILVPYRQPCPLSAERVAIPAGAVKSEIYSCGLTP